MNENEKMLLAFAVTQSISQMKKDISEQERNMNSPLAEKALKKVNLTKEEVIEEIQERKDVLEALHQMLQEYMNAERMPVSDTERK